MSRRKLRTRSAAYGSWLFTGVRESESRGRAPDNQNAGYPRRSESIRRHANRRHRGAVLLTGADAHDALDRQHEDLAVADFTRASAGADGVDGRLHEVIGDADLDADLFVQLHLDGHAAVGFDALGLAAVSLHVRDRQAGHF